MSLELGFSIGILVAVTFINQLINLGVLLLDLLVSLCKVCFPFVHHFINVIGLVVVSLLISMLVRFSHTSIGVVCMRPSSMFQVFNDSLHLLIQSFRISLSILDELLLSKFKLAQNSVNYDLLDLHLSHLWYGVISFSHLDWHLIHLWVLFMGWLELILWLLYKSILIKGIVEKERKDR